MVDGSDVGLLHQQEPSSFNSVMLCHDVSNDLTLHHIDLYGKVNDEGVYHNFVIGNNRYTLNCYQVHKNGEAMNDHKVKTGCFWSKRL